MPLRASTHKKNYTSILTSHVNVDNGNLIACMEEGTQIPNQSEGGLALDL